MMDNLSIFHQYVFTSSTIIWGILVTIASLMWLWWRKPSHKFPPGPRGIPILGVLPWLGERPERVLKKWSQERYGPVMSARFGMEDVVVLSDFETIQQALVKQGFCFSGRPNIKLYTQSSGTNGIYFAQYDEKLKNQKKFIVNILKKFGQGKKAMETLINEESEYVVDFLKSKVGKPFYLGKNFHNFIGNIICRIVFGRRFEFDDPSFQKVFDVLRITFSDPNDASSMAALILFYNYVKSFPPFSTVAQKFTQALNDMTDIFAALITEHKKTFDENHIRDYIDAFIYEQKFGTDNGFSDEQLMHAVRDLFGAGTETASSSLCWIILALLHHPQHQAKIVAEIDSVFGPNELPSMNKKTELPFTCAFIEEINRYIPVAPLSITHLTQKDVNFAGYFIPKETKVIPNIWGAHFDPETWKNPMNFDPYRYIDEGQFIPSKKIITFGIGPRFCPGESIARTEIFLLLVKLLQKFTISGTEKPLPGLLSGLTALVHTPKPFEVILNLR